MTNSGTQGHVGKKSAASVIAPGAERGPHLRVIRLDANARGETFNRCWRRFKKIIIDN